MLASESDFARKYETFFEIRSDLPVRSADKCHLFVFQAKKMFLEFSPLLIGKLVRFPFVSSRNVLVTSKENWLYLHEKVLNKNTQPMRFC